MELLAIEIDLDSFFDVNLIVFTTLSFVFSVIVISFLVFALRPLNKKARIAQSKLPEKINITYIRLLIYGFAQFIAFVTDVFLVIFGHNYKLPWFTTSVFLTLILYKLVFVLFKDFRDLGYNASGIISTLKAASKIATDQNLDSLTETMNNINNQNMKNENNETKKSKIRYKNGTISSKLPYILMFIFLTFSCSINQFAQTVNGYNVPLIVTSILPQEQEITLEQHVKVKWKGEWIDMKMEVSGKDLKISRI